RLTRMRVLSKAASWPMKGGTRRNCSLRGIATFHAGQVPRWSFTPGMSSATPRSLLDALDGQREDRLHRRSTAINVQQLAGDEARLVSAEENHGVADVV